MALLLSRDNVNIAVQPPTCEPTCNDEIIADSCIEIHL